MANERIRPLCLSFRAPPAVRPQAILIGKMIPEWIGQGINPVIITYEQGRNWDTKVPIYKIPELKIKKIFRKILPLRWLWRQIYFQRIFTIAKNVMKKHHLNLVFSFSNPQESNILGAMLKKRLGIKFISHFSDPWSDNPYQSLSKSRAQRVLKKEEDIIRNSDKVIFVSKQLRDLVMKKYPVKFQEKSAVIPHCYELSDYLSEQKNNEHTPPPFPPPRWGGGKGGGGFSSSSGSGKGGGANIEIPRQQDKFVLSYIGVFYKKRNPEILFEAMKNLLQEGKNFSKKLKLKLVGCTSNYSEYSIEELKKAIENYQLKEIVEIIPQVNYKESLKYMKEADCLVVIDADIKNSPFFPSKVVEYAPTQVPIIGITPKGSPTADFLEHLGYRSFDYQQTEQLADYLRALILRRIRPQIDYQFLKQFDVRFTTSKLIKLFDEVLKMNYHIQPTHQFCENLHERGTPKD